MVKPIQQPPINQQIYTVMKQLLSKYTEEEIADVVRIIRSEITEAEAEAKNKSTLKQFKARVKQGLPTPHYSQGLPYPDKK
jgi:hypothetical protein